MQKGDIIKLIQIQSPMRPGIHMDAFVEDFDGITLTIRHDTSLTGSSVIIEGVLDVYHVRRYICGGIKDGKKYHATMQLVKDDIVGKFFSEEKLVPHYNPSRMVFEYDVHQSLLELWVKEDILEKEQDDSYLGCGTCETVVIPRTGCGECWSARLSSEKLIKHFTCGYIGKALDTCSHCNELLKEKEYEIVDSSFKCKDCGYMTMKSYYVCSCVKCRTVMPLSDAKVIPVYKYKKKFKPLHRQASQ